VRASPKIKSEFREFYQVGLLSNHLDDSVEALNKALQEAKAHTSKDARNKLQDAMSNAEVPARDTRKLFTDFLVDARHEKMAPSRMRGAVMRMLEHTPMYPHDRDVLQSAVNLTFAIDKFDQAYYKSNHPSQRTLLRVGANLSESMAGFSKAVKGWTADIKGWGYEPPRQSRHR
jgi:hypothetical protein